MKIYIRNFRGFTHKEIEIPVGKISLLKGDSGKGKTTILEAMRWCLFGNLRNIYPMGFKPSSSNQTSVVMDFPHLKMKRIERSQPPEILRVYVLKDSVSEGESPYQILESEEGQRYIESIFSTKSIWEISSYLSQGDRCPLMTSSNAEKMNLLCEILFGNKLCSDIQDFQNPDFYSDKIEKQLDEVSATLTQQTGSYNTIYGKYMEAIQGYQANPHPEEAWTSLPTSEVITNLQTSIDEKKQIIQEITKQMVETKGKETEKEFLSQRLRELQEKIKAFESVNSEDQLQYLKNVRVEIDTLEKELQVLQELYLSTLAQEQKKEIVQKELTKSEEAKNSLFQEDFASLSLLEVQEKLQFVKQKKQETESLLLQVKQLEKEESDKIQKLKSLQESFVAIQTNLSSYSIQDVEKLRLLIQNTKSFHKLKEIQEKEPEKISISFPEESIPEMTRSLPVFLSDMTRNEEILQKYNLVQKGTPITSQVEAAVLQHLSGIQQVLTFVETMKKEVELDKNHTELNTKMTELQREIETIKSEISQKEREFSETPLLDLEKYITKKTEIQMNIGDTLHCPDCQSSLEIHQKEGSMKLCKSNRVRYTAEEGKKKMDLLQSVMDLFQGMKTKETELQFLEKEKQNLPLPKPEYLSEQARQAYTDEVVQKYKSFYDEVSKVNFKITNEFAKTSEEAELFLQQIPLYQNRKQWELEYQQVKTTLSIQDDLSILSSEEMEAYEKACLVLPGLLSQKTVLEQTLVEEAKLYQELQDKKKGFTSIKELEELLPTFQQDIESLELKIKQYKDYKEALQKWQTLQNEMKLFQELDSKDSSSIIQQKIESGKIQLYAKKETLSGFSQFEILTEDYRTVQQKLDLIQIVCSSEMLSKQLQEAQNQIDSYERRIKDGSVLLSMAQLRSELEQLQVSVVELTNKQSHLNRLRMLIIEVTNSSLQNLVDSINSCTNSILEELFEHSIHLELKLFKENKKTNMAKPQINFSLEYNNNTYDSIVGLSGGEKDRISLALTIALACINPSPILFLDECMSSLNVDLRENCIEAIQKFLIAQTGKTCINIEHSGVDGYYDQVIEL